MAASMPMVPPAPVRFSTSTCCPIVSDMRSPRDRAMKSIAPPGASGTMKRMGLAGQSEPCAHAFLDPARPAAMAPVAPSSNPRGLNFDMRPPFISRQSKLSPFAIDPVAGYLPKAAANHRIRRAGDLLLRQRLVLQTGGVPGPTTKLVQPT